MIAQARPAPGAAALAEAKAQLRVDGTGEDALIAGLLASAVGVCEAFVGQMLLVRPVSESVAASAAWTRLGRTPVRAVTAVASGGMPLPADAYAVDIDGDGDGWVRLAATGIRPPRLQVTYEAGLAADWAGAPDPLRQGVLRLTEHLYARRDESGDDGPPAAVAALWRPFRRMSLGAARYGAAR